MNNTQKVTNSAKQVMKNMKNKSIDNDNQDILSPD